MRALAVLALLAGVAAADNPFQPRGAPVGFSHAQHERDVAAEKAPPIPCTRCHTVRGGLLVGKPDHAACFASCHAAQAPVRHEAPGPDRIAMCNPCHAETALAAPKDRRAHAVAYPPYDASPDFALQLGHKTHRETACAACHDKRKPPHKRCAGCHDGGKARPMLECERCHVASRTPARPRLVAQEIRVTSAFSHQRHATRGAAKQCVTCHPVTDTDGLALPRPGADTCAIAGCHDGKASFGITAQCRTCHQDVPATKFEVERPTARFSHATPAHEAAKLPCAACHPLAKTGEVQVAGHAACSGCHADDFGKRAPTKCGACHNSTEPWRPLVPDRAPPETSEFGAALDHGKHALPCASCHSLATARTELRPPRGHAACSTAGCHAIAGGPAPQLGSCEACHVPGLAQQRERARLGATWSVRARFAHAPHRVDRAGKDVVCTRCHTDLTSASVLSLATPAKQTCADCHDGSTAFDVTGTKCTRCHLGK